MNSECVHLENTPIFYYITNKQAYETVFFLHAAFADHTLFDEQAEYFSRRYRVITLDLLGHGKSVKKGCSDGMDKMSEYINKIMEVEKIQKAHFAGISLGSVIIQDFANKYPHKVLSLCSVGGYDINDFDFSIQKQNNSGQIKMMLKAIFSIKWFAESNKKISAFTYEAQEKYYNMNLKFKKSSLRYLAKLNSLVNKYPKIKREYPLMIGCGEKDIPTELEISKVWHEKEPDSKLKIFKNSGHLVNLDVPEEYNKAYSDFLSASHI